MNHLDEIPTPAKYNDQLYNLRDISTFVKEKV